MMVRGPLLVNDKEIRASAVKIIRYCLNTPDDVHRFVDTCLPTLIVRIIDTNYDENSFQDREHALKLIRYVTYRMSTVDSTEQPTYDFPY